MLVNTLLVGLLDRDNGISGKVLEFSQDFLCHLPHAVFNKARIFMRGEDHMSLIATLQEFVDTAAHRLLEDSDDLLEVHVLVVIRFNAEESLAALVMGGHGNGSKEIVDFLFVDIKVLKNPHRPFLHDILCTGAGSHSGYFSTDTLPDYRCTERTAGNCPGMDLDHFVTGSMTDGSLPLDHEFAAHEYFRAIGVFMAVKELARYNTAQLLDLVHIAVNRLLENFIDDFEIPGKVGTFETAWQINEDVEIGDEDDRALFAPVHFNKFFHVFDADPGKVDPYIRG